MATSRVERFGAWPRRTRWFLGAPFRPQTYLNLVYLLLAFPLGLVYFVLATVGVSLSLGLAILLVGVLIAAGCVLVGLALVSVERRLTNRLLGTTIEGRTALSGDRWWDRALSLALDRRTWTALLALPVKFALGLASFVTVFMGLSTAAGMVLVPLYYDKPGVYVGVVTERAPEIHQTIYLGWNYLLVGFEWAVTLGYWEIDSLGGALVVAVVGAAIGLLTLHLCNGLAWLWAHYLTWSMDGSYDLLGAVLAGEE